MKDFHCRDAGLSCDFVARGSTKEEVLAQARLHAASVHHLDVTKELAIQVYALIHDESSPEHVRSLSQR